MGTSPAMPCATVTTLTVLGDAGGNYIDLEAVGSAFTALGERRWSRPAGGSNLVFTSPKRDVFIGSNDGDDQVWLDAAGAADGPISLGGDTGDAVNVMATAGDDTITVATGTLHADRRHRGPWTAAITGTRYLGIVGAEGDDVIDATALDALVTGQPHRLGRTGRRRPPGRRPSPTSSAGPPGPTPWWAGPRPTCSPARARPTRSRVVAGSTGSATRARVPSAAGPTSGRPPRTTGGSCGPTATPSSAPGSGAGGTSRITAAHGRTGVQVLGRHHRGDHLHARRLRPTGPGAVRHRGPARPPAADHVDLPSTVIDLVVPSGVWTRTGGTVTFSGPYQDVIVGTATTVNVRHPFTDPEQRFAHRVVRDLEVRIPTAVERDAFAFQLESGSTTRAQLVLTLSSTDVVRGIAVDRAFVDIMRRTTDTPGRLYWIGRLRSGLVTRRMRANLYGSNEYFNVQGDGDVEEYVRSAYNDILGREAEESGLDYWIGLIEGGTPRGTVADRFLNTSEARTVVIRDLFLRWVDREPTPTELSTWLPQLGSSTVDGETALIRFLAGSGAYFTRPDA